MEQILKRIVIATGNKDKMKELKTMLEGVLVKIVPMNDFDNIPAVVENGQTFKENALIKARTVTGALNMIALADDSGLEVDFLKGQPGVKSARFAGEHATDEENNEKLLKLLKDVPLQKRTARFKCVIALTCPDGREFTAEGTCEGYIVFEPKGNKGFGYDPLFWVPEYNKTFGEMEPFLKNQISHRAKALKKIVKIIGTEII